MPGMSIPASWLCIAAGIIVFSSGIVTIIMSRGIVNDFKLIMSSHRRILLMTLLFKGLSLCGIGVIIGTIAMISPHNPVSKIVFLLCAVILMVFGVATGSLAGRSDYILFKIGPIAYIASAMLILAGIANH
jgi:uncharacterized protein YacL